MLFDFNGTISDDEPVLARIFARMFAEIGIEVSADLYFAEFAGYSDPEIVERMLHRFGRWDDALAERLIERRSELYYEEVAIASPVRPAATRFVREVAARVPVAIASGAAGAEIAEVLRVSGLADVFEVIVAAEDVERGKPDPEGYLLALERRNATLAEPVAAADCARVRGLGDGGRVGEGGGHALRGGRGHHAGRSTRGRRCDSVCPGLVYTNR